MSPRQLLPALLCAFLVLAGLNGADAQAPASPAFDQQGWFVGEIDDLDAKTFFKLVSEYRLTDEQLARGMELFLPNQEEEDPDKTGVTAVEVKIEEPSAASDPDEADAPAGTRRISRSPLLARDLGTGAQLIPIRAQAAASVMFSGDVESLNSLEFANLIAQQHLNDEQLAAGLELGLLDETFVDLLLSNPETIGDGMNHVLEAAESIGIDVNEIQSRVSDHSWPDGDTKPGVALAKSAVNGPFRGMDPGAFPPDAHPLLPPPMPQGNPTGACCIGMGCSVLTEADCLLASGTYLGDGESCVTAGSGPPLFFSSSPNLPIPDAFPFGASDTISVPDAYLISDVNVHLDITHTFTADLDVALVAPDGTTVVLFTDVCGSDDDILVDLDDEATAGAMGSAASCAGTGPVGAGGPFAPESPGSLSDFDGLSTTGDWRLVIIDDGGGDVGTLVNWTLTIEGGPPIDTCSVQACCLPDGSCTVIDAGDCAAAGGVGQGPGSKCNATAALDIVVDYTAAPIPMNNETLQTDTIVVTDTRTIADLNVDLFILHADTGEVDVFLQSPAGTIVKLVDDECFNDDGFDVLFDDDAAEVIGTGGFCTGSGPHAGTVRADDDGTNFSTGLDTFEGESAAGTWTLWYADDSSGADLGTLDRWSLHFELLDPVCPQPPQGACCLPTFECIQTDSDSCSAQAGTFQGPGVPCVTESSVDLSDTPPVPVPVPDVSVTPLVRTITVPNTETVLDVNVDVTIDTTDTADLDIYLRGPNGVVIQLGTDNCFSDDDLDVTYDDESPVEIGSFGYCPGPGPIIGTFRPDDFGDLAAPLSAFDGLSAAGDWELIVFDDAIGDLGEFVSWSLHLTLGDASLCGSGPDTGACCLPDGSCVQTIAAACAASTGQFLGGPCSTPVELAPLTSSPNTPIPATPNVEDVILVADSREVLDVNVEVNIQHPSTTDLDVSIRGPNGVTVVLSNDECGSDDDIFAVFDDEAILEVSDPPSCSGSEGPRGTLRPDGSFAVALSDLDGQLAGGAWTLIVDDDDTDSDLGTLLSWSLILTVAEPNCGAPFDVGACCVSGNCTIVSEDDCATAGGVFAGNDTNCVDTVCTLGGCCFPDDSCAVTTEFDCDDRGGIYQGDGSGCEIPGPIVNFGSGEINVPIPLTVDDPLGFGASHTIFVPGPLPTVADLDLVIDDMEFDDVGEMQIYLSHGGPEVLLVDTIGGDPDTNLCNGDFLTDFVLDDEGTVSTEVIACAANASITSPPNYIPINPLAAFDGSPMEGGWTIRIVDIPDGGAGGNTGTHVLRGWTLRFAIGGNNICDPDPTGACCLPDGSCQQVTESQCATVNGNYGGDLSDCADFDCRLGACCVPGEPCASVNATECGLRGGTFQGPDSPCTFPLPGLTFSSGDVNQLIPDNDPTGIANTITVGAGLTVTDVNVSIAITHTFTGDLDVMLMGPDGTIVELFTDVCGGDNDVDVELDDEATAGVIGNAASCTGTGPVGVVDGTYQPEGSLAPFDGLSTLGDWTLLIVDDAGADVGTLDNWSITFGGPSRDVCDTTPTGACCLLDGTCFALQDSECTLLFGSYNGDGSDCADVECRLGACCLPNGDCIQSNPGDCSAQGGDFQGVDVACVLPAPALTFDSGPVNEAVTQDPLGTSHTILVPGGLGNLVDVDVVLNISNNDANEMYVELSHGPTVVLIDSPAGCTLDDFFGTVIDDEGALGPIELACATGFPSPPNYQPNDGTGLQLSAFDGAPPTGAWTIRVVDLADPAGGTEQSTAGNALLNWSLRFTFGADALVCDGDVGTCCISAAEACLDLLDTQCAAVGGAFTAGASCATDPCPFGACCDPDIETCQVTLPEECDALGFAFNLGSPCLVPETLDIVLEPDVAIPDGPLVLPELQSVVVDDPRVVLDLDVDVAITHTFNSDMDVYLLGPDGTIVQLFTDICGGDDDIDVVLDDEAAVEIGLAPSCDGTGPTAGTFRPENDAPFGIGLSAFDGLSAAGTWTLVYLDDASTDVGTLDRWSLHFTLGDPVCEAPKGACCIDGGQDCIPNINERTCDDNAGSWLGEGSPCSDCPLVFAECCPPCDLVNLLITAGGAPPVSSSHPCFAVAVPAEPAEACCATVGLLTGPGALSTSHPCFVDQP